MPGERRWAGIAQIQRNRRDRVAGCQPGYGENQPNLSLPPGKADAGLTAELPRESTPAHTE